MSDLIRREDAIDAILGEPINEARYPSWYASKIKALPSAEVVHKPDYSYEADMVRRMKEALSAATCEDCIWHVCNYNKVDWDTPSAEAVQGWVPCSERLPKDNKEVLISCEWGVDIGEHSHDGWRSEWINHYDDDNVLAWMPLPEPYKGGDDE